MGYRWSLTLRDSRSEDWVGEHRPELIDLNTVFSRLVEMEPGANLPTELWRASLPPEVHLVRLLGPRTVHVHVRNAQVHDLVIKLSLPRLQPRWRLLAEQVRHSRSHRAYFWAHRLRALGIDTPRPIGFIERAHHPALAKSFTVSEYIFAPSLTELRDEGLAPADGRQSAILEKRSVIRRVAELVRALHQRGLFHGDLHAGNLLVGERSIMLIDLESVRRFAWRSRAALKNLARLNRDFLNTRQITTRDRMRFLEIYLEHAADRRVRRQQLFFEIAQATEQKLATRGEAFR